MNISFLFSLFWGTDFFLKTSLTLSDFLWISFLMLSSLCHWRLTFKSCVTTSFQPLCFNFHICYLNFVEEVLLVYCHCAFMNLYLVFKIPLAVSFCIYCTFSERKILIKMFVQNRSGILTSNK